MVISRVDEAILDLTEAFCHRVQRLTGRTNIWLAVQLTNLSIIVYFVWAIAYFWNSDILPRTVIAVFCGGLLYVLSQTVLRVPIETYEASAYQRVAKKRRNPRRIRDLMLRISFLTTSVVLVYPIAFVYINSRRVAVLLTYSLIVLTTIVLYLLACDPLPPCTARVPEWLRGLVPRRRVPVRVDPGE